MNFASRLNYSEIDIYIGLSFYLIINLLIIILNIELIKNEINRLIIFLGIIIRSSVILCDNFIKFLSFSGKDGITFHYAAIDKLNKINNVFSDFPFVTGFIAPLYKIFKISQPIVIQSINLLLFWLVCYSIQEYMKERKIAQKILIFINFSLISALLNISVLREEWMVFLLTIATIQFCEWTKDNSFIRLLCFFILISLATYQHTGVIFMILLPFLYKIFKIRKFKRNIIIALTLIVIITMYPKLINIGYLKRGADLEKTLINQNSFVGQGSTYISEVNSFVEVILSFPLRYIYFLFSPLPHQIRGINDVLTFFLNSSIYIYLNYTILMFIKNYKKYKNKNLIKTLIIVYFICNFVYALGTVTAGTALRHRDKFYIYLLIIYFNIEFSKRKKMNNNLSRRKVHETIEKI